MLVEMAASGSETSVVKTKRLERFTSLLTSAACEWFLIFLLLLDALLSYLLKRFATYCELQLPCLLCSRLDHILDGYKPEFYQNLFCSNHKSEISSMILCHIHGNLVDGHRMCDDCLLSLTANTRRNTKTQRLLAGKLGVVLGGSGLSNSSLSRDLFTGSKGSRPCTCCGKLWKSEQNVPRSIHVKSPGKAVLKPYIPLPHVLRKSRLNHRDNIKKIRGKASESEGQSSFNPLSHVGYSVLRFSSDSESEFPFSDDDEVPNVFHENIEVGNYPIDQVTSATPKKCVVCGLTPEKPSGSSPKPPLLSVNKHQDVIDNGELETNWQQENQESSRSDLPELISLDEVSPSHAVMDVTNREPESEDSKTSGHYENSLPATLSELMTLDGSHTLVGAASEKSVDVTQAHDTVVESEKHEKISEKIDGKENTSTETDLMGCDSAPQSPTQENSSNLIKSSVTTKGKEVPDIVIEQSTTKEVDKVKEELDLSPSLNYSLRESNVSSVVSINHVREVPDIVIEQSNTTVVDEVKEELELSPPHNSPLHESNVSSVVSINHEREVPDFVIEQSTTKELDEVKEELEISPSHNSSLHESNVSSVVSINHEREVPDFVIEQSTTKELDEVKEELEISPSHNSSLHESNMSSVVSINHGREVPDFVIEQSTTKEVDKVKEELELSPSPDVSINRDHSPEIHPEASSSNGIKGLEKSASVETGLESLDESNIAEIEGEPIVDRLKRQIEYDKKCMDALHKELEEERNASAIAANEAMSMITRLQEEKAALKMEALQYLRMMDEQAEYDNDEFEKVNDLLTEKEKEIQDLEAELEYYRSKSNSNLNDPMVPIVHNESRDSEGGNAMARSIGLPNITDTINNIPHSEFSEASKASDEVAAAEASILEFEEEKVYITQCLKSLEKKLHRISSNRISSQTPNIEIGKFNQRGDSNEETDLSIQKNVMSNGSHNEKDDSIASDSEDCSLSIENNKSTYVGQKSSMPRREVDLVALENEISDLNDRLEALEFDHDLFEHIINSLKNGTDGKQLIQDIAHQLHELRKVGTRSRW